MFRNYVKTLEKETLRDLMADHLFYEENHCFSEDNILQHHTKTLMATMGETKGFTQWMNGLMAEVYKTVARDC